MLRAVLPQDMDIAILAIQYYPGSSETWFWLGEAVASGDPLGARQAYLRTVSLAPRYGLAWCRLGRNYKYNGELEKATEA